MMTQGASGQNAWHTVHHLLTPSAPFAVFVDQGGAPSLRGRHDCSSEHGFRSGGRRGASSAVGAWVLGEGWDEGIREMRQGLMDYEATQARNHRAMWWALVAEGCWHRDGSGERGSSARQRR
jgi:hypothetical protein